MAYPSVTYSFTNGTTISATEVNQNFTDLINGLSDGTKDLNISALTAAGTTNLNGAVNLGNATSDDVTVTGYVAATVNPKTANSFDLGGSSQTWRSGYFATSVLTPLIKAIDGNGIKFQENGGTEVMSISDAGAVTAGPASGTNSVFHQTIGYQSNSWIQGFLNRYSTNTCGIYVGGTDGKWSGYGHADGHSFGSWDGSSFTTVGTCTQAGAWTLGPAGLAGTHTINGRLDVTATSGLSAMDGYRKTSTASDAIVTLSSDVGGTEVLKWRVEADGDTISSTGSYTSDERAKKNLAPIQYGLAEVLKLSPKAFNWWHEEDSDTKSFCISTAQEVEALMPEMVRDDGLDGPNGEKMKAIYDKEVMAVMVKAIQEMAALQSATEVRCAQQQAMIEELKAEVAALRAK